MVIVTITSKALLDVVIPYQTTEAGFIPGSSLGALHCMKGQDSQGIKADEACDIFS